MSFGKLLTITHLSCFVGGVLIGKSIDADELAAYRSANTNQESVLEWAKRICLWGTGAVATITIIFGIGRFSGGRKSIE